MRAFIGCAVVFLCAFSQSYAQENDLGRGLVGTWLMVANTTTRPDGTKVDTWGANPRGIMVYDATGHFTITLTRSEQTPFAANDRLKGSAEENAAAVRQSVAYFGRYTVEGPNTVVWHIEGSTFPNWVGIDQKRTLRISGDRLTIVSPTGGTGGSGAPLEAVWQKAK